MSTYSFKKSVKARWSLFLATAAMVVSPLLQVGVLTQYAHAATITTATATFGRVKESIAADSVVMTFGLPTGIQTGGGDTITLTFSSDFALAAEAAANFDVALGDSATCSSATYTEETVALTASATEWGVDVTGNVVTLSPETDDTLTAGFCIRIRMGTAAVTGGTGSASTVTNGAADDDDTIVVGGVVGDSGTMVIEIITDDQVVISATVNATLTFSISSTTCALGTLSTASVSTCTYDLTSGTNASGGAIITIDAVTDGTNANLNRDGGASDFIDNIAEDGTVTLGVEGYGIALTAGAGWTESGDFADDDTPIPDTLTTILSSGGVPVASAASTVTHRAAISSVTPAGTYSQTVQYIATGTF